MGDIAVVNITPELANDEHEIGRILLALHKNIRVVAKRTGPYAGEYRVLPLRVIAGENRLDTLHRENGITLHLDISQVYYSVRSAHERARIASLVQPGERVAVLCSGVGPFPLIIGRHSTALAVIGIEKNPVAHGFALRNLQANPAVTSVSFHQGDAAHILPALPARFDRILVVLPYGGEMLLLQALDVLAPGGTLHFYDMQTKGCTPSIRGKIERACRDRGRCVKQFHLTLCGHCGLNVHRVCADTIIGEGR